MSRKKKSNKEVEAIYEEIKEDQEEVEDEETSNEVDSEEIDETEEDLKDKAESEESENDSDDDEDDSDENDDSEEDEDENDSKSEETEDDDSDVHTSSPVKKFTGDITKYILIGIIGILIVIVCILITTKESSSSTQSRNTSTDALQEFYKEYDEKDLNVIFFASATCGYCTMQKPILENISKDYNMDYYAIDASELSDTELNEIVSALGIQGATPTTVITKGGKVVATNEGYLDGKELVEFFVNNKVLKSDATYKQEDRIIPITYSKFKEIAKKKSASLVLLDQSACSSCVTVREVLNKLGEENDFKVNYLNAAYLSQEDGKKLVEEDLDKMGYKADSYKKDKTVNIPLLLIIKDGKIKDYVLQKTEKSDYTKVLKKYDFIKK